MLNELAQAVAALDRLGIATGSRHARIDPMGKNRALLIVRLGNEGKPGAISVISGKDAATLFRVKHRSEGSSFPGFNLPTPLRTFDENAECTPLLKTAVSSLSTLRKNAHAPGDNLARATLDIFGLSVARKFTVNQDRQFDRSLGQLVAELQPTIQAAGPQLENLRRLLAVVATAQPTLTQFSDALAQVLASGRPDDRDEALLMQDILFGALDWRQRTADVGSAGYWKEKAKKDKDDNQPVYLDVMHPDPFTPAVAHPETSRLLNEALLQADASGATDAALRSGVDAYSGEVLPLQDKFPSPKIAELGNLKLFSVNTNEVLALRRYGLEGSQLFPTSAALAQKMNDTLIYLASDAQKGKTCIPIPSAHQKKRDLLVVYLEEAPDFPVELAEMFGGEAQTFSDADFRERTETILHALEGKLAASPDLNIRLLGLCSLDKGRNQLSLDRRFHATEAVEAARRWQAGARNTPAISIAFSDKVPTRRVLKAHVVPHPLDVASTLNWVWSADAKAGFSSTFQRAVSPMDAYDVFLVRGPLARPKTQRCLGILLARMTPVLGRLGAAKASDNRTSLGDRPRWQCAKAVSLLGIFLQQLGQELDAFMKEPTYEIGRLLNLADSLHQQYCRHVRKGKTPSQLLGNALFSTALEQPVFALARLGERLTPYHAWARTFHSDEPSAGVGLVKSLLRQIAGCTAAIQLELLPSRMGDVDKAKLLLGYLADNAKTSAETSQTETS